MIRRVIQIEEDKCNGCGACAKACHEGAIGMVNGKAKLMRDDYCDGLGDCLPACPMDAIHFIEREAEAYDEAAVLKNKEEKAKAVTEMVLTTGSGQSRFVAADHRRYTETVSADPENKTGNKTGIRILPDGSSGLRIWRKRYFRICRFRTEPESESGRTGSYRSFLRRIL